MQRIFFLEKLCTMIFITLIKINKILVHARFEFECSLRKRSTIPVNLLKRIERPTIIYL